MFFIFSKLLGWLISPFYWIFILILLSLLLTNRRAKRIVSIWLVIFLFFFTNAFIYKTIVSFWIPPLRPVHSLPAYDVGVVLGGALRSAPEDTGRVFLNENAGDRIVQAVQLYKQEKIQKILFSGGAGSLIGGRRPEALDAGKFMKWMGIDTSSFVLESSSRNTYENALYSAQILKNEFQGKRVLLITNSIHMKRSLGCFTKQGINCDVFPVDEDGSFDPEELTNYFMPKYYVLTGWERFIHEVFGYLVYKAKGYC